MDRSHVSHIISDWQQYFGIEDWDIVTEQIDLDRVTVEYNGHKYFVGILRNFDDKKGRRNYNSRAASYCVPKA
jgi:hypothetical protein